MEATLSSEYVGVTHGLLRHHGHEEIPLALMGQMNLSSQGIVLVGKASPLGGPHDTVSECQTVHKEITDCFSWRHL